MPWGGPGPWWPLLVVIPLVMLTAIAFMAWMMRGMFGFGRDRDTRRELDTPKREDPMVILRERYVRGEIDTEEFERRLDGLLRSDPEEKMPWWNT